MPSCLPGNLTMKWSSGALVSLFLLFGCAFVSERLAVVGREVQAAINQKQAEPASARTKHWSFVSPVRPAKPAVKNESWVRNPIDQFVLARLESQGITPSPEADRATLIRRLSLDLLGLSPSIVEVDEYLND